MIVLIPASDADAQFMPGARPLALGSAVTGLPDTEWALFGNPALMIAHELQAGFYGGRYYGLAELTDLAVRIALPAAGGTFGLGVHRFGDDLFSEINVRTGYSLVFDQFGIGLAVNYRQLAFGGPYENLSRISLDAGLATEITSGLILGSRISPVWSKSLNGAEWSSPQEIAVGLSYGFMQGHFITIDAVKEVNFPLSFRSGVEVSLVRILKLRAGMTTEPETWSGGLGLELDPLRVNIAVQRHWLLGLSPGIDLSVRV